MEPVLTLENEHLRAVLAEDCSAEIVDKSSDARWSINAVALQDVGPILEEIVWVKQERGFMEYYGGRFRARQEGEHLRVRLFGNVGRLMGEFSLRVELDGPWLVFRVFDIDEALPSLTFPPHVHCDRLVLASDLGEWHRQDDYGCRFLHQAAMTMRWFGGLKDDLDHNFMAIFDPDGMADGGLYVKGRWAAPAWVKSMHQWDRPRSIRYRFGRGGYVGLAKTFRQYAKDHGLFRSLTDKIAENPDVDCLRGGRILSFFQGYTDLTFDPIEMLRDLPNWPNTGTGEMIVQTTHADVKRIVAEAKDLGMTKGVYNLRGTWAGGYDYRHPDIWPPDPALGSLNELKEIFAESGPFLPMCHDNYQDIYEQSPSFPDGAIVRTDGTLLPGGWWHGGQCYIMNPREAIRFAKRNYEQHILPELAPRGAFVDTLVCIQGYEDFHPDHRITRQGNYDAKLDMLKYLHGLGLVLGSEEAGDFGMAWVDILENRHQRQPGRTIPIWPLVFHDAAYCCRYPGGNTSTLGAAGDLCDILWGYAVMWAVGTPDVWDANKEAFRSSLFVDEFHARIATDEMVNHRFLTDDEQVEQSEWSSGLAVIANFADEPRTVEGKTVDAGGYLIVD
jgi:hypothetical protein